jgi:hypothetical protein
MATMKQARAVEHSDDWGKIKVDDVPVPEPRDNDVLVKVSTGSEHPYHFHHLTPEVWATTSVSHFAALPSCVGWVMSFGRAYSRSSLNRTKLT